MSVTANGNHGAAAHSDDSEAPTIQSVAQLFDGLSEKDPDPSQWRNTLLQISSVQQRLYHKIQEQKQQLAQLRVSRQKKQRNLQANQYERDHLQQSIDVCKSYQTPSLLQLAREETSNFTGDASRDSNSPPDDDAVLQAFLQANIHDPSHKTSIVQKLQGCLQKRAKLEKNLASKRLHLQKLQKEHQTKQSFLKTLPTHVQSIERASQRLSQFMSKASPTILDPSLTSKTGSDRLKRLELAQNLPPPLYTLFCSFQAVLDQGVGTEENKIRLTIPKHQPQVHLSLPVLERTTVSSKKRATLVFDYDPDKQWVTVRVTGCPNTLYQGCLLDQLFPNDHALLAAINPNDTTNGNHQMDTDGDDEIATPTASAAASTTSNISSGKAYLWCNYIAGLYQTSETSYRIRSARVVVLELQRRIRANAALKHILQSLEKLHMPDMDHTNATCTLSEFVLQDTQPHHTKLYRLTITKGSRNLHATVQLSLSCYPSTPPIWKFDAAATAANPNKVATLYDSWLQDLERKLNVELLQETMEPPNDGQPFVRNESAYEWILVEQLRTVLSEWEKEDCSNNSSRKRKGRDRKVVD